MRKRLHLVLLVVGALLALGGWVIFGSVRSDLSGGERWPTPFSRAVDVGSGGSVLFECSNHPRLRASDFRVTGPRGDVVVVRDAAASYHVSDTRNGDFFAPVAAFDVSEPGRYTIATS